MSAGPPTLKVSIASRFLAEASRKNQGLVEPWCE